ncbi:MAG: site-specific DNA-methyltransferase [Methylococcales bacterium]|nr:site-specific DNA-methyltransferase [Methylococcales bacterium]
MKNKIYYGDNLDVLRRYIKDESVDLCYIDPPFNSKRNYNQIYNNVGKEDSAQAQAFIDTWTWDDIATQGLTEIKSNYNGVFTEQSIDLITWLEKVLKKGALLAYLVSMTLRIAEIHRVLKPTGSFYFHCDPTASHYLKLVLDAIFCVRGGDYINEIVWKRSYGHGDSKKSMGRNHDVVFYYIKNTNKYFLNRFYHTHDEKYINSFFKHNDERGLYKLENLTSPSPRPNLTYEYKGYPSPDKGWRVKLERMQELDRDDRLHFPAKKNGRIMKKVYLHELEGQPMTDIWVDINPLSAHDAERLGYPTQKPEALLERIIKASSNEGNIVLDAYCGCGTTVAVANRLNRQWIGIDITYQSISLILKRLTEHDKSLLDTIEINGVPKDINSAIALANKSDDRTRKEFEKWMVLTYSNNYAMINEKKGGDGGIDGMAYIPDRDDKGELENKKVLFSVKSNVKLSPTVIRDLNGTIERDNAACGILLTLYPMPNLVKECKQYGFYHNALINKDYPKIQVVCVDELFNGVRLELPNVVKVLKKAEQHAEQVSLF